MNKLELMNLDKQFCKDCKTGKEKAWASYFSNDGILVTSGTGKNIKGKEQIELAMKDLFSKTNLIFTWEPIYCEISDDQTLGMTMGIYHREYKKENENIKADGKYTTIWKKENDEWKIVMDIGN